MQVDKVNFGKRELPKETTKKMQELLLSMNANTQFRSKENTFTTKMLSGLKIDKDTFIDSRFLAKPTNNVGKGKAKINLGKLMLEVDIQTGEIIRYSKPMFSTWKKAIKKANLFIDKLKANFDDNYTVKKGFIYMQGLTKKGAKALDNEQKAMGDLK